MKTFKHLFPTICSFENLELAFRKARRGKRSKANVAAFEGNLDLELLDLQDALLNGSYRPGGYRHFTIYEGKPRRISAASFRDRVVHHALCNVIEPIWEARFIHDSYACRKGKGTHAALDRCTHFARRHRYVLQTDIVQFFPSVDHAILRGLLARTIADPKTMRLIDLILDSGAGVHRSVYQPQWFPGDDLLAPLRPRGLPIGNQTSQFWSNVYLNELDRFVKQDLHCPAYLRYCDDLLLFADDKSTLHHWRRQIEQFLVNLRLIIHPGKTAISPVETGIPFLGFRVYADHRRLKRENGVRFQRRVKPLLQRYETGEINIQQLHASIGGWIAHASHGDTWGLRRTLLRRAVVRSKKQRSKAIP
jgi:RNA-directed DNA polymerase